MQIEIKNVVNHGNSQRGFNTIQAAKYIGMSESFLSENRIKRVLVSGVSKGPTFFKVGRRVIYLREDLDRWLESFKIKQSVSQGFILNVNLKR
jgi:hypothetical protein